MLHYLRNLAEFTGRGIKFRMNKHSFIVIKGINLYYIYKRCEKSVIYIDNIKC